MQLSRIARRVPVYAADIRANPRWLPMFALARIMMFRKAAWRRARSPGRLDVSKSLFRGANAQFAVADLKTKGLYRGLQLPREISSEISQFARRTKCFANLARSVEFYPSDWRSVEPTTGKGIVTGHFFERVMDCPAAVRVQTDPLLLQIAQDYLGGEAHVTGTRMWWSFPTLRAEDADLHLSSQNRFHFDLDDWRGLKFFFYIEEVDHGSGPHYYVLGSQNRRALRHQFTALVGHPSEEIEGYYGKDAIVELTGPAGYGFAEDPFGFHMGTLAKTRLRLILEISFGVSRNLNRRFHG